MRIRLNHHQMIEKYGEPIIQYAPTNVCFTADQLSPDNTEPIEIAVFDTKDTLLHGLFVFGNYPPLGWMPIPNATFIISELLKIIKEKK